MDVPHTTTSARAEPVEAPGSAPALRQAQGERGTAQSASPRRGRLRRLLRRWLLKRHPRSARWSIEQRCLYIVPTGAGWLFGGTLALMLLAAINLQLALGYLMCFALAGAAFASMLQTHRTLRGLELQLREPVPGFAGQPMALQVECLNPGPARHGIALVWDEPRARPAWVDVPAQGQALVELHWTPPARGRHELPTLRVQTSYPFGLFRAWTLWRPATLPLAWPAPEQPAPPLPRPEPRPCAGTRPAREDGDFAGVRAYRRGDAPHELLWKKSAHHGELVSRERQAGRPAPLWLRWQDAGGGDTEARLSRLAAWVLAASRAEVPCALELPGQPIPAGLGAAHRQRLLQALALWDGSLDPGAGAARQPRCGASAD
ncbi:DUF58 domain-containing protein [Azohydromonas caseinilytica]|uniref:DUF58 domain-containing protein n=1 Tax=Azohydromonas caseinilytica TaxID=2728836 RepID=A0A848FDN3_9BURK|nr:DUF58 domain-containing protein [Azohydromonas caseinilytica]NML17498.1 DUF58 domain-containing protein [Azohydromonas caseinilytica]